ncbi:hypothetical protein ILYODFUR_030741 [Ilyodon furcidens]|uniref:BED-type domain-containing protein n=1 Tax=Ilyodon furcidens TaxID=33524 RepID=A0ABV0TN61_9TELE
MPDTNTALHAQERNDVGSRWRLQQCMADRKHWKVRLHFSKHDAHYALCNIRDAKCTASSRNTSNLRRHLVEHQIFVKDEACTIFVSLRSTATTPSFSIVSPPAF